MGAAVEVLRRVFGYEGFRGRQGLVIERVLGGRSVLAVFPTGGGKSLCYQLPAVVSGRLVVVVSPLIALMKDQVDYLRGRGVEAERLDSTLEAGEADALCERLRGGAVNVLYLSPEGFVGERMRRVWCEVEVWMLAVDEAHCISEWGHGFRPDYLKLGAVAREVRPGRVLALTATATPAVRDDICRWFGIEEEDRIEEGVQRPNLEYVVDRACGGERDRRLVQWLGRGGALPAIVYVTMQRTAGEVAGWLRGHGIEAMPYHAGMPGRQRAEVQDRFMGGALDVVVATIAFGMGVDKGDVRSIVHYNLPKSLENYVQESGRAGRDGGAARCVLLACRDDLTVLENFVVGTTPSRLAVRAIVERVARLGEVFEVSFSDLAGAHDVRVEVVATMMAYLEEAGEIEFKGRRHRKLRVRVGGGWRCGGRGGDGLEGAVLAWLAERGAWRKRGVTVDPEVVAEEVGGDAVLVRRVIEELGEGGEASVEPAGLVTCYRRRGGGGRASVAVGDRLYERFVERERRESGRLASVVAYVEEGGCLAGQLAGYFGEADAGRCGICSTCVAGEGGGALPGEAPPELGAGDVALIRELIGERHAALKTAEQLARFLCGIASPATRRVWLTQDERFGVFARVPFAEVRAFVGTMNLA